jgi:hypothetical protein
MDVNIKSMKKKETAAMGDVNAIMQNSCPDDNEISESSRSCRSLGSVGDLQIAKSPCELLCHINFILGNSTR